LISITFVLDCATAIVRRDCAVIYDPQQVALKNPYVSAQLFQVQLQFGSGFARRELTFAYWR
jgi:hypothetical protein